MVVSVTAITADREPVGSVNIEDLIADRLGATGFAGAMIRAMANYPSQKSTISGYRRTGTLGRGWRFGFVRRERDRIQVEVFNDVRYAVYVQGPKRGRKGRRQTREMRRRGWPNITDESRRVFADFRPPLVRILTQAEPRIQRRRLR